MSWSAYRLRRRDNPILRSRSAPHGYAERAAWLAQGVLWVEGWLTSSTGRPLGCQVELDGHTLEAEARRFTHGRPDLQSLPGATGQILILVLAPLPEPFAERDCQTLGRLHLHLDETWYRLTGSHGLAVGPDLESTLPFKAPYLAPETRQGLSEFLHQIGDELGLDEDPLFERNRALWGQLLEPPADPEADDPEDGSLVEGDESPEEDGLPGRDENGEAPPTAVSEPSGTAIERPTVAETTNGEGPTTDDDTTSLSGELEPVVEEPPEAVEPAPPLPTSIADPQAPIGLAIDRAVAADPRTLLIQGWSWDRDGVVEALHLHASDALEPLVLDRVWTSARGDVAEFFEPSFGPVSPEDLGFLALAELPETEAEVDPSRLSLGLALRHGDELRIEVPRPVEDPALARELLIQMTRPLGVDFDLFDRFVEPSLGRAQERLAAATSLDVVTPPTSPRNPRFSLLIWLESLDWLEHQMASLADDPDLAEAEILFGFGHPAKADDLGRRLHHLARLYGLDAAGFVASRVAGAARGLDLLAERARGQWLAVLDADTLAREPGWLSALATAADRPEIGVVGPKLLDVHGSIADSGVDFVEGLDPRSRWSPQDALRGFHPALAAANREREVTALAPGCLMIARQRFEDLGGFAGHYIGGQLENLDLCLRSVEAGWSNRYVPTELYHLGGLDRPVGEGWAKNPWSEAYNRWLFDRRWSELLELRAQTSGSSDSDS